MGLADEITRKHKEVERATHEYIQFINSLEGKYDSKESEIKMLDLRIEKLKAQADEIAGKATFLLSEANEEASQVRNQARKLMDEANEARISLKQDQDKAKVLLNEAQVLMVQAQQRQREADSEYKKNQERKNRLLEAARQ